MPNHITTILEINVKTDEDDSNWEQEKQKLNDLYKRLHTKESDFDFNGIVKMPKSLLIEAGSDTNLGIAAFNQDEFNKLSAYPWFATRYPGVTDTISLRKFLEDKGETKVLNAGKQAIENTLRYGYKDWYDWSWANWGTKWNSYEVKYLNHSYESDTEVFDILVKFETAWSPPLPVLQQLAKDYRVRYTWIDECADDWHDWEEINF